MSIEFTKTRALATRSAQAAIANSWVWSQKTLAQWDGDITAIEQLMSAESDAYVDWRDTAELWQSTVDKIQEGTRQVANLGPVQFRNNPGALKLLGLIRTDGESRADIYAQGLTARAVWDKIDGTWEISPTLTLATFSELLDTCNTSQKAEAPALTSWRLAGANLNFKAETVDRDNVDWYTEATRRFAAGTVHGDTIRSTVPTTSRPEQAVDPAVISNLMVSGGDIHFDCSAPRATRYTFLQQTPGSPAFVVIVADSPDGHLMLHGQVPGVHRLKAFGSNSRGRGEDSEVVEVTVAVSAAA